MKIFVFGNEDLPYDSLPLRLLPRLQKRFPRIEFIKKDPNEEWDAPPELTIIDTAEGIENVTVFDDLAVFQSSPRISLHDFDALANIRLLQKIGKIKKTKIIGLPPTISEKKALREITKLLSSLSPA